MKLSDPVTKLPAVGPYYAQKLARLGIDTIDDLLHHVPTRLLDFSNILPISDLRLKEAATIIVELVSITNVYTKTGKLIQVAKVTDGEENLEVVWIRQPYLTRTLKSGMVLSLSGELNFWGKKRAFIFPQYEVVAENRKLLNTGKLIPVYPATEGISSKWIRARILKALELTQGFEDFLREEDLKELDLKHFHSSIKQIHDPKSHEDWHVGKKRLAFNELMLLQIQKRKEKNEFRENNSAKKLDIKEKQVENFISKLPFRLTNSQKTAINEIRDSLSQEYPMNRLLEGEVGSGKTVVAAFAIYAAYINGLESVMLAPTQVLAEQHFNTLSELLSSHNMRISLVTGGGITGTIGKADLFVGTHALLHKPNLYQNTGTLIIDEQHKFGVKQRAKILQNARRGEQIPHLLTMTATPIPRTITLTLYGDLDISTLREIPKGRKKVRTWIVPPKKREAAYKWIEQEIINNGTQAFVVCPLIEESQAFTLKEVKAATKEYEKIRNKFKNLKVGLLHGRLKTFEKDKIIQKFRNKSLNILVATPVVEVGVDIPNATVMMIEGADRFGLAQLHQLRGRVGRGNLQSYCLLFTESKSKKIIDRLKVVAKTHEGRELAEMDLKLRGPGEIFGIKQHGIPELKIASWTDIELIKTSRNFAQKVVKEPKRYQEVIAYYNSKQIAKN